MGMKDGALPTLAPLGGPERPPERDAEPEPEQTPPARPGRWRPPAWTKLAILVVVAAASLTWVGLRASRRPAVSSQDVGGIVDKKVDAAISGLKAEPPDGVGVFATIRPGLVIIEAGGAPRSGDPSGLGTGVIVNTEGQILTALHVVRDAARIRVTFADGTESPAAIESADADHDVAVLKADRLPEVVVPAVLGGGVRVGDEVFAVGHPLGLVASLSAGVVSGLDRSFSPPTGRPLAGLIQFDAAVNPGNSGGPLLNRAGQVIGIVTGLARPTADGGFAGIGFAVPIQTAGGAAGAPAQ